MNVYHDIMGGIGASIVVISYYSAVSIGTAVVQIRWVYSTDQFSEEMNTTEILLACLDRRGHSVHPSHLVTDKSSVKYRSPAHL